MLRRDVLALGLSSLALPLLGTGIAPAQGSYPEHPIRLVVPRAAGGVVDIVGRMWGEQVKPHLGQVVVENIGGGGGLIGGAAVARAKPDGYTLLAGTTSELVTGPMLMPGSLQYDPAKDLTPVAMVALSISAIMVHGSLPVKNLKELAAYAKANPNKLSYGSAGTGSSAHLGVELFKQLAGVPDIVHVPYKGANLGLADFYAGHLPIFAASVSPQVLAMHAKGTIRILSAGSPTKLVGAPHIPISAENGFPQLITVQFMGIWAPGATPRPIIDKVSSVTLKLMESKAVRDRLIKAGFEPVQGSGPAATHKFVQEDIARWAPLLKKSGIKLK